MFHPIENRYQDELYKMMQELMGEDVLPASDHIQVVPKAGRGHLLPTYMANEQVKNRLGEFFKGRMGIRPGINAAQMGFLSRLAQDPQYEDIVRTVEAGFGRASSEGYTFSTQDLTGFRDYDLTKKIKKAKKGGNPEIVALAEDYEEFINTLIEELKLGLQPLESLQKGIKFYPELRELAKEYEGAVRIDSGELREAYDNYLRGIVENAAYWAKKTIEDDNIGSVDQGKNYEDIAAKIKKYRKAITDGAFQVARDLGEQLLDQTEYLKQIFNETQDTRRGQLTRIQNEILSGESGAGRSSVGLADLFYEATPVQLELDLTGISEQAANGASESLNGDSGNDIGADFARGIIEGAEDELDIQSPSEVFKWIGSMVRAGFENGVQGIGVFLSESIQQASDAAGDAIGEVAETISTAVGEFDETPGILDSLLETEGAGEQVDSFFADLMDSAKGLFDSLKERYPILGGNFLLDIGGQILEILGLAAIADTLIEFSKAALETAMQLEGLERSIVAVSRNALEGAKNISFIRAEAKRLSLDLVTAQESYQRILGATRDTPLEGLQTEQIFSTLATTAKNRGLTTEATSRLFLGFEQVISKGEFRSEEVRGQLAEVLGDIQNLLASSVGVPISQLSEMMEAGDLKAPEVMPKLIAQLNAQNAALGNSAGTAQAAQTRLNNSIIEFQDAVGRKIQPVQKLGLNALATAMEALIDKSKILVKLVVSLLSTVLVNLAVRFLTLKMAVGGSLHGINLLFSAFARILPRLLMFAQRFVLITAAIEVWTNNLKLAKNAFPDLDKRIEGSTKRLDALKNAFDETAASARNFGNKSNQMELNEGWEVPEWMQGIVGGERLNWDNLVRKRHQRASGFLFGTASKVYESIGMQGAADTISKVGNSRLFNWQTQAQKKQADFVVGASDLMMNTDRSLGFGNQARNVIGEVQALDKKARELQSKRLDILPGDAEALKKALEEERKVLAERDKLLKKTSQYQESLQGDIQDVKDTLSELDELDKTGGTQEEREQRQSTREALKTRLKDLEDEKKAIDAINSRIPKFLSKVDRLLRNRDEKVRGFMGNQDDDEIVARTEAIKEGIAKGLSDTDIELKLDDISKNKLKDRIGMLREEIDAIEEQLSSAYLKEGGAGLEKSAASQGLELTPETLERMLEEGRSSQETKAAKLLLQLDEYEGILAQSESGLVDLIRNKTKKLKDFNRIISDYFFRITQQIKEAQLETERLVSQLFYTDIKNKLEAALAPGSNTFVNQIIDNVQAVIDQAQQVAEKIFGDRAAVLGFQSEERSLQLELKDFIKQIGNAGDAAEEFARKLRGGGTSGGDIMSNGELSKEGAGVAKNALSWQGKHFKQGVYAMCAGFVRQVLKDSGVELGVTSNPYDAGKQPNNGELMARSFFGSDIGKLFKDKSQAKPGDLVGFFDTYQYGQKPGAITHVGIYSGNDMMVDRSTSSAPVRHRSIDTFGKGNYIFMRPYQYNDAQLVRKPSDRSGSVSDRAKRITQQLIDTKRLNLGLSQSTTEQEREALAIQVENIIETNKRQAQQAARENARSLLSLDNKLTNLYKQYNYQSAANEVENNLRSLKEEFINTDLEIFDSIRDYQDSITSINQEIPILTAEIARLEKLGTPEALVIAKVQKAALQELINSLPTLEANLQKIKTIQSELPELEQEYQNFITAQGQLKVEQEKLNRQNNLIGVQANITAARGTLEQQRQVQLAQERLRLQLRINQILQEQKPGTERERLIESERRQSEVNTENINFDSRIEELNLEKRLVDLNASIAEKRAELMSRFGINFGRERLKQQNAIAQENIRYQMELAQIEKELAGQPELLRKFTVHAKQLNALNLTAIKKQFKSLGNTVFEFTSAAAQGFFNNYVLNFFDRQAERERALLEERLRYAEELNRLEEQHRDEPGKLAHLKNRAKLLNEKKLDKITNEFNVFSRAVDLGRQAVLEFTKQLAAMLARQAAAKFLGSIFGAGIGGAFSSGAATVGNDFGAGVGTAAFTAKEGITVPNFEYGGTSDRAPRNRIIPTSFSRKLASVMPSLRGAFRREGSRGVLGVFTPGEEILSIKTGEAGRYQALKKRLGINPLAKIPAFSEGGTVDISANIASGFASSRPSFDLSGLNRGNSSAVKTTKIVNLNQTVVTPNADSFRHNQDQRNQDLLESLRRGV